MTDDALIFLADQFGERPRMLPDVVRMIERLVVASEASTQEFQIEVQLPSPLMTGQSLSLDPSEIGLPEPIDLEPAGAGRYITRVRADGPLVNGEYFLPVRWHDGDGGHYLASVELSVLPDADLALFDRVLPPDWSLETSRRLVASPAAFQDRAALALTGSGSWRIEWKPAEPEALFGYRAVAMDFYPGTAHIDEGSTPRLRLGMVPGRLIELIDRVDLTSPTWQTLVIPMSEITSLVHRPMESLSLTGNLLGEFYLADVRLVRTVPPVATSVMDHRETADIPDNFALLPPYPNPFNSQTEIRYTLAKSADVELVVYNALGQSVATLVRGERAAGTWGARWDGRDAADRPLASGLYLYRLRAGTEVETRKLLLLR